MGCLFTECTKIKLVYIDRVAKQPGKPREPGKVREFDIWPKSQGIWEF